ncbi:unnamed protein product [Amoebophrya sp. A120]|nr:unnamed protein product [Amoebophrya sp. A120]|eukprot:GSA120T00010299001.1
MSSASQQQPATPVSVPVPQPSAAPAPASQPVAASAPVHQQQSTYVPHSTAPAPQQQPTAPQPQTTYVSAAPPAPPQTRYVYAQPATTVVVAPAPVVGCRDDTNPIGAFGCDKRVEPNCCVSLCCPGCTITNYEGLSIAAILAWIPFFSIGFWPISIMGCFAACCWTPPIWGVHYNVNRAKLGAPVQAAPAGQTVTYVAAGSDTQVLPEGWENKAAPFPEFLQEDEDLYSSSEEEPLV